jgi:hypothetical protein
VAQAGLIYEASGTEMDWLHGLSGCLSFIVELAEKHDPTDTDQVLADTLHLWDVAVQTAIDQYQYVAREHLPIPLLMIPGILFLIILSRQPQIEEDG